MSIRVPSSVPFGVPRIVITPPDDGDYQTSYIAQARVCRLPRSPLSSPDHLSVSWRPRRNSPRTTFSDAIAQISNTQAIALVVASIIGMFSTLFAASNDIVPAFTSFTSLKTLSLPSRRRRRASPIALFVILFTLVLSLTVALHGSLFALDTPIYTAAMPRRSPYTFNRNAKVGIVLPKPRGQEIRNILDAFVGDKNGLSPWDFH